MYMLYQKPNIDRCTVHTCCTRIRDLKPLQWLDRQISFMTSASRLSLPFTLGTLHLRTERHDQFSNFCISAWTPTAVAHPSLPPNIYTYMLTKPSYAPRLRSHQYSLASLSLLSTYRPGLHHRISATSPTTTITPTTAVRFYTPTMSWMDSWSRPSKRAAVPPPLYLTANGNADEQVPYCHACGRVMSKSLLLSC